MNGTPALGERITIILIPKAGERLRRLQQRTNLSPTDLANRAITLYEFIDAQLRDGQEMIARDKDTGQIKLVQLLGASEGQATPAGPACLRRGQAGPERRHGRHRRQHQRHRPSTLQPLAGLAGQGVRTA